MNANDAIDIPSVPALDDFSFAADIDFPIGIGVGDTVSVRSVGFPSRFAPYFSNMFHSSIGKCQ
jgi:hypothetical protein